MAKIAKRRGKWVVDWYDTLGVRRWKTCSSHEEAKDVLAQALIEAKQRSRSALDPKLTLAQYAKRWLEVVKVSTKPRTHELYSQIFNTHIAPDLLDGGLGDYRVRKLSAGTVRQFLIRKLTNVPEGRTAPLGRQTVKCILATLRALLNAAKRDGLVTMNVCDQLGKELKLGRQDGGEEEVQAFDRDQLAQFLEATRTAPDRYSRRHYPMFLTGARAGLRLGELLGLQWADIDFEARRMRVQRQISRGRHGSLKDNEARTVDMSRALVAGLQRHLVDMKKLTLKRGWSEVPPWVFCTVAGTPSNERAVRKSFRRMLKLAGLPLHFNPKSLRHTFASQLLSLGVSPEYVRRQMGHSSVVLTTKVYGKWLPFSELSVDRLDVVSDRREMVAGSKVVDEDAVQLQDEPEVRILPLRSARGQFVSPACG